MFYYDGLVKKMVPPKILNRFKENLEHSMTLYDAFEDAVREYAAKGSDLWNAWYYGDFREYIPDAYDSKYLDFTKYPRKY